MQGIRKGPTHSEKVKYSDLDKTGSPGQATPTTQHVTQNITNTHTQWQNKKKFFFFFFLSPVSRSHLFPLISHPFIRSFFNFFLHQQYKWSWKKAFECFFSSHTSSIYFSHGDSPKNTFWAKTDQSVGLFLTFNTRMSCQETFQP